MSDEIKRRQHSVATKENKAHKRLPRILTVIGTFVYDNV